MKSDYQLALDYVYGYTDYEKQSGFSYNPERFDLRRVERLLKLLGSPHRAFQSVHVAGTKGKGSTSAITASVLTAAGYRVALYTSPHLHTFRERIQVDGQMIGEGEVVTGVERLKVAAPQVAGITSFELITALAFDYFAREQVELAVIEVGMGGRLDATNVIHPLVAVITPISYDHTAYLGDTLAAIAGEKAGIIKPGVPVVSAAQHQEAQRVIEQIAADRGCPLSLVGRDWQWTSESASPDGQRFAAWPARDPSDRQVYDLPLLGAHQQVNATTALVAIACLRNQGISIPDQAVHQGLASVRWPGRVEILGRNPWVIIDGAHNADSMQKLSETLVELFPYNKMILIFGASADKDLDGMWDAILPLTNRVLVTQSHHPRAASAQELVARLSKRGASAAVVEIGEALDQALALASPTDMICATGSLFVIADVRASWFKHTRAPLPPSDPE